MNFCPFCDGDELSVGHGTKNEEGYPVFIYCDNCGCCGPITWVDSVPDVVTKEFTLLTGWNRRPEVRRLLIERAKRTLDDLIDGFEEFKSVGLSIDDYMKFYNPVTMKKLINLLVNKGKM
jgi:hypothetical protein